METQVSANNSPLQKVIEELRIQMNNLSDASNKELEKYKTAQEKMNSNIFAMPDYYDLFYNNLTIDAQELNKLYETLRILKENKYIELTETQIENIRKSDLYIKLMDILQKQIIELAPGKDIYELIEQLKKYEKRIIDDETIEKLYEIIAKYNFSIQSSQIIFKGLMHHINMISQQKELIIREPQKLTEKEIQTLLQQYNCDISKAHEKYRELILTKGNFQNITKIIEWCKENNLPFDIEKQEYSYLILCSNIEILNEMKKLSTDEKHKFDLAEMLKKVPATFGVEGKMKGRFDTFKQNIELLSNLGYNISQIMKATSVLIFSHETIKHNIAVLKQYGFDKLPEMNFAPTSLKSSNIQIMIDQLIEQNQLDYFMNNSSSIFGQYGDFFNYLMKKEKITENNKKDYVHFVFDEKTDSIIHKTIEEIAQTTIPSDYIDEQIDELEQFRNSERTYLFSKDNQSVLISSMKVKTIYPILLQAYPELDRDKLLLFALTYKSIITKDQFDMIRGIILKEKTL